MASSPPSAPTSWRRACCSRTSPRPRPSAPAPGRALLGGPVHDDDALAASTTDALPLAPSLGPTLRRLAFPHHGTHVGGRVVVMTGLAVGLAVAATAAAQLLGTLIAVATQLAYHGRWATTPVAPAPHHLGVFAVAIPIVGGVLVGLMARYGSRAIRGHGIPEAMEQVLTNDS